MTDTILFYKVNAPYGFLSNFSRYPIVLDDKYWLSTEHYFQAQKFAGTDYAREIQNASTPMVAAKMGRSRKWPLRKDWEQVKDEVMYRAVRTKFEQYEDIRAKLLATVDAELVEHTAKDNYWGDGGDGTGLNKLGQILMQVRTELKRK